MRTLILSLSILLGAACTPQQAIALHFGQGGKRVAAEADRVAWCESRHHAGAVSPTNDHGLFQINAIHRRTFEAITGQAWAKVYEPFWNARFAWWLYEREGWRPWACRP